MAPEIFKDQKYTLPVDWWSLGIIVYEMIVGFTPFYHGGDTPKIFNSIEKNPVQFPPNYKVIKMS